MYNILLIFAHRLQVDKDPDFVFYLLNFRGWVRNVSLTQTQYNYQYCHPRCQISKYLSEMQFLCLIDINVF